MALLPLAVLPVLVEFLIFSRHYSVEVLHGALPVVLVLQVVDVTSNSNASFRDHNGEIRAFQVLHVGVVI